MFKWIGEILDELTEGILGLFIGFIIFLLIFSRLSFNSFSNSHIRNKVAIILFFAYSFFGGHVIDSVTSGSLFYYLLANIKSTNANFNNS